MLVARSVDKHLFAHFTPHAAESHGSWVSLVDVAVMSGVVSMHVVAHVVQVTCICIYVIGIRLDSSSFLSSINNSLILTSAFSWRHASWLKVWLDRMISIE